MVAVPALLSALGTPLFSGRPAWAEGVRAVDATAVARTKTTAETIERARRLFESGHGDEANTLLEDAYQASGDPALLLELGELRLKLGRGVEAKRVFEAYIKRAPSSPARASVERRLREIEMGRTKPLAAPVPVAAPATAPGPATPSPTAAPLPPRAPTGPSAESVPPAGAASPVYGPAPAPAASPGATADVAPAVAPPTQPPAPASSSSPVLEPAAPLPSSSPAEPVATRRAASSPMPAAAKPAATTPSDSAPALLVASARSTDDGELPLPRWVPWSGAAVTVGLLTGAVLTGLVANRRYDELKNSCGATVAGCSASAIDDVRTRARTTNVLWGAALLVGVATGVTVYVDARAGGVSKLWTF